MLVARVDDHHLSPPLEDRSAYISPLRRAFFSWPHSSSAIRANEGRLRFSFRKCRGRSVAPVCKDLPEHVVLLMAETHRRFVVIVVLFLIDHVLRLHHLLVVFRHFLVCIPLPNLLVNPLLFLRGTAAINNNITSSSSSRATEATLQSFCGGRIGLEPPGPKGVEETQEGLFGHFLLSRPRRSLLLVLGTALHSLLLGGCR